MDFVIVYILKQALRYFSCWQNAAALFCCEAPEMFCGLHKFTWLSDIFRITGWTFPLKSVYLTEWHCSLLLAIVSSAQTRVMQQLFHLISLLNGHMQRAIRTLIAPGRLLWSGNKLHGTTAGAHCRLLSGERLQLSMHKQMCPLSPQLNHPFIKGPVWPSRICSWT